MINLQADEVMRLQVKLSAPRLVGPTGQGHLNVIPIIGGTFTGPGLEGTVVEGGADWSMAYPDGLVRVFAKYMLKTIDDEYIAIENEGILNPSDNPRIRTKPTFQANSSGKYCHLNSGVYVGELAVTPGVEDSVDIVIYKLR